MSSHDVVIIGAGPAGLAAALRLESLGIRDVVVLEREHEIGGIPRHCGHLGFGWHEFRRVMTGPRYAAALRERCRNLDIRTATSVVEIGGTGEVRIVGPGMAGSIVGRRVLVATGVRETPRSARLIGGDRPPGVLTTGALQQFVYLLGSAPFKRPVIVGTELVSFSALLTCHHAGMKPVAMIESRNRITAPRPGGLVALLVFGVPVMLEARIVSIDGRDKVEAVTIERAGKLVSLSCDGVIFSGQFVPESALYALGPFEIDGRTGGPAIDQHWRTTNRVYFAAGNTVHPVETAGWCWKDGIAAAEAIAADFAGTLPEIDGVPVKLAEPLRYIYPQRVVASQNAVAFHGRVVRQTRGRLVARARSQIIAERPLAALPERRISLVMPAGAWQGADSIDIAVEERP